MTIFLAVVGGLLLGFVLWSRKYNNPFKLYFLFGKKGAGKSTYMVKLMRRDLRHGWDVYTNMSDVHLDGVRIFSTEDLKKCAPEGSKNALYIDEAGLTWDKRNFKSFDSGLTEFFALQRKYHCKMVINSQSYDVDLKIRDRVDGMALQTNIGNIIGITRPIRRNIVLTEPVGDAESRIADKLTFAPIWAWRLTLLPRYFKFFESFRAPARDALPYMEVKTCAD